jgi:hypothetical protein
MIANCYRNLVRQREGCVRFSEKFAPRAFFDSRRLYGSGEGGIGPISRRTQYLLCKFGIPRSSAQILSDKADPALSPIQAA